MRRVFLVMITVIALGVALAGVALANAGPHGSWVALEDRCASCHRAHSGAYRLTGGTSTTIYGICTSCHDGTSSYVNVLDGALQSAWGKRTNLTPNKLLGGGFEFLNTGAVGSSHNVSPDAPATRAWGYQGQPGNTTAAQELGYTLSCSSCHDPHGSTNYAILRQTINTVGISIYPTRGLTLPADDTTNRFIRWTIESYGGAGSTNTVAGIAYSGLSGFCGTCHTGYLATTGFSGSGAAPTGVYTHRVGMAWNTWTSTITGGDTSKVSTDPETTPWAGMTIPLANNANVSAASGGTIVTCLSCHFAHGTSASMGSNSLVNNSTNLLRIANRGTCQGCHTKS